MIVYISEWIDPKIVFSQAKGGLAAGSSLAAGWRGVDQGGGEDQARRAWSHLSAACPILLLSSQSSMQPG